MDDSFPDHDRQEAALLGAVQPDRFLTVAVLFSDAILAACRTSNCEAFAFTI